MIRIFADFNCPFCYVQHKRIESMSLDVEWCFVEHAPQLSSEIVSPEAMSSLIEEYNLICQRAFDVKVVKPAFCVNTKLAILTYISLKLEMPEIAQNFISDVYQAYWIDGKDISNHVVLGKILEKYQIRKFELNQESQLIQSQWQKDWQFGGFDTRIPSMENDDNAKLLGLQHIVNIHSFVNGRQNKLANELVCQVPERSLVYSLFSPDEFIMLNFETLLADLEKFDDPYRMIEQAKNQQPELIIIDFDQDKNDNFQNFELIRRPDSLVRDIPVIYFMQNNQDHLSQTLALNLGATGVLLNDDEPGLNRAKINRWLISSRKLAILFRYSTIDSLTGLANKRQLESTLERFWRIGCNKKIPISIVMLDIDQFKHYNDCFGHLSGDNCLIQIAEILKQSVRRESDVVTRFGGEEFTIVLINTGLEDSLRLVEQIRKNIEMAKIEHAESANRDFVTVSFGVCHVHPHPDQNPGQALELADRCLYQAKVNGRNKIEHCRMNMPDYQ